MSTQAAASKEQHLSLKTRMLQFYELTKPRVVALIIFTAIVGMFLAVEGLPSFALFFWGTLGIGMASAAGAAINQLFDADADSVMKRTRLRPLPTGQLTTAQAMGVKFLGKIPFDPKVVSCGDSGTSILDTDKDSPVATAFDSIAGKMVEIV